MSSEGFTKLHRNLLTSSVWSESKDVRILWITILAMADPNGYVVASVPGLARQANLTVEETEVALGVLLAPDPYSRTPDLEGRRLVEVDGGWRIVTYQHHRKMGSREARKERDRQRKRAERAGEKAKDSGDVSSRPHTSASIHDPSTTIPDSSPLSSQAEAEADQDPNGSSSTSRPKSDVIRSVFRHWVEAMGKDPARTKLTKDRRQKIQGRLRDGYSPEDIKQAIDGCKSSPFHRGENDQGRKYDGLDLICRNGEKLEQFMQLAEQGTYDPDAEAERIRREHARKQAQGAA